jgi:hypothetical protein
VTFTYPEARIHRRHGPRGYANYESYRPWLRDEFAFRCAYCLKRETWGQVTGEFDIDHFRPQWLGRHLAGDYANLVYACRRCNAVKFDQQVDDPFTLLTGTRVLVIPDGRIRGCDTESSRLIVALDLNSPRLIEWRVTWLRIIELAKKRDRQLWRRLIGFPADLPDLSRLRPRDGNLRPEGIAESWFELAKRGELPAQY